MPETDKKAPRVINKSGTLKMDDKTAATKQVRDIAGRKMDRKNRRIAAMLRDLVILLINKK